MFFVVFPNTLSRDLSPNIFQALFDSYNSYTVAVRNGRQQYLRNPNGTTLHTSIWQPGR